MPIVEELAGLPPYGPPATAFSLDGRGAHREGKVVRIAPDRGPRWVGNFERGAGAAEAALACPDGRHVVIVAGRGYVVDPIARALAAPPIDPVRALAVHPRERAGGGAPRAIALADLGHLHVLDAGGLWRSERLSLDDFAELRFEGDELAGRAWDGEGWVPFALDLVTRRARGGAGPRST